MKAENLNIESPIGTVAGARAGSKPLCSLRHSGLNRFNASVRVPVVGGNREYLRALRAAELATWEAIGRKPAGTRANSQSTPRRRASGDAGAALEAGVFALLAACAGFVVAYGLWIGSRFATAL